MTPPEELGCIVQLADGRCGKPVTSGLPLCGSCLRTILDEPDPRRRRTLAGHPGLAGGVVQQLAEDPDDHVRAQVGGRGDLDTATANRLGNPDRESSPLVWRCIAATPSGAVHAWELIGSDDPATLAILASNQLVDRDALEVLQQHPDPDVSWTASSTLAGQPPNAVSEERIRKALAFDGLPLEAPPESTRAAAAAVTSPEDPTVPRVPVITAAGIPRVEAVRSATAVATRPAPPATKATPDANAVPGAVGAAGAPAAAKLAPTPVKRNRMPLVVGGVVLVVAVVVVLGIVLTMQSSGGKLTAIGPTPDGGGTPSARRATTTTAAPTTTTAPVTTPPTTAPPQTAPPQTAPPQTYIIPQAPGPITASATTATSDFCQDGYVNVTILPNPTGSVTVTDDQGRVVATWSDNSGVDQRVTLPGKTATLTAKVTTVGTSISVKIDAHGFAQC